MALARKTFPVQDSLGNVLTNYQVEVRREGLDGNPGALEPLFSDRSGLAAMTNPFTVTALDGVAVFHCEGGAFQIEVTKDAAVRTSRYVPVGTASETDIPPTSVIIGTADQATTVLPTGNALDTLTSFSVQGSRVSNSVREFLVNIGLVSATGSGASAHNKDGVAAYIGADAQTDSGDIWSLNSVTNLAANLDNDINAHGYELDFNNVYKDYTGLSPIAAGMAISGAGTFLSSCALLIAGTKQSLGVDPIWTMGLVFTGNSIRDYSILDQTSSVIAHLIQGSHTYGVDFVGGTFSAGAIRLPNVAAIVARDAGDTVDAVLLSFSSTDNIELGGTGFSGAIFARGALLPDGDGTRALGGLTARWSNIFGGHVRAVGDVDAGTVAMRIHNTGDGNVVTKLAALNFFGTDTVGTAKEGARLELVPGDSNWTGSDLLFYTRVSDAIAEAFRADANGLTLASGKSLSASTIVAPTSGTLTIASGVITVTGSNHTVDTEAAGATDDLDTINGGVDGMILFLRAADSARTVVVKDGTGNIQLAADFTMDHEQDSIMLRYVGALSAWLQQGVANNGA